jgi:hypothetical protein
VTLQRIGCLSTLANLENEMLNENQPPRYLRVDDFFKSPRKTTIAEDVRKQVIQERENTILNLTMLRQQEDWSFLSGKIVGAEGA